MQNKLQLFYQKLRSIYNVRTIESVLDWDQQVGLPLYGGDYRAEQLSEMAGIIHQRQTDPRFIDLVEDLASNTDALDEPDAVNVREAYRKLNRERKLPESLVKAKSKISSQCYQQWVEAKPKGDFKAIEPTFTALLHLLQEEARCTMVSEDLYDSLLDIYEPGGRVSVISPLLTACAVEVSKLLPGIIDRQRQAAITAEGPFDQAAQMELGRTVAQALGYSFRSGRLDVAPHPFQTTLGPKDFRITTRCNEETPFPSLYGVIHEVGHALYEMGLDTAWFGTPMGTAISLGVHESQSRFWENIVGRSGPFSTYLTPLLRKFFPNTSWSEEAVWQQINKVSPSCIRVEADEVTYTLHIVIRMELEVALVSGSLNVSDLPDAWNEKYRRYLSVDPSNATMGVLQDIHWYSGSMGYFSTYALGNLYGAMFTEKIRTDLSTFDELIATGNFSPILQWLTQKIHRNGMRYLGPELIHQITGKNLSFVPFINYLKTKFCS